MSALVAPEAEKPLRRGNNGGGRKKIAIDLKEVEAHAARGLDLESIALSMGFSARTLHRNMAQSSEVTEAIARGRAAGQKLVSNALFNQAVKGHVEAAKFYLARRCDWRETVNQEVSGANGAPLVAIQINISRDDADL